MLTGYNEAFIIDNKTKEELITKDSKSADIIRPILRGRDIKRYSYDFADLWLINAHNGIKEKSIKPINIDDYPAIKSHLDKFYPELEKRADKGNTPYNLRNCAYMEDFYKQKIVWLCISDKAVFAVDNEGKLCNNAVYFISTDYANYLCSVMNSKLIEWYFDKYATGTGVGTNKWEKFVVELIPIPIISLIEQEEFVNLVETIQELKRNRKDTIVIENILATKVYELYNLTQDEINFIESQ